MAGIQSIPMPFDMTNVDPYVGGGGTVPGGWYLAAISDMEVRENNNKESGHNLYNSYTVHEGEFKGRKVHENLNLWHKTSSGAVEIANKHLSSIAHAVGQIQGTDLNQLAQKVMLIEVELEADQPDSINPNTGETQKGRKGRNNILQRKAATPENIALHINGQPANSGAAPQFTQQAQAQQAASAPAFSPAAPVAAAAAPAAQAAPAFAPAQAAAPAAAPAPAGGPAVPPWKK